MQAPTFAPQLYIPKGTTNIDFYTQGLGATELRHWKNDDGSYHVAEFSINGAVFQVHEVMHEGCIAPAEHNGTTVLIGLFVEDVDALMQQAITAGATETSPAEDYDYGYRQGTIKDPFGHLWMIEKKLG